MRALGLDLGGSSIKAAVVREGDPPRVLAEDTTETRADLGPDGVLERMVALGREVVAAAGPVERAGAGLPAVLDLERGSVKLLPNLPGQWPGKPVAARLARGLGVPVSLVNDVRAFSLAELVLGAGRGCRDMVCVAVGTGVGGGVVVGGRLHLGQEMTAGELGHQTVDPAGPRCGCGNRDRKSVV